jgi:hypothetical protein
MVESRERTGIHLTELTSQSEKPRITHDGFQEWAQTGMTRATCGASISYVLYAKDG